MVRVCLGLVAIGVGIAMLTNLAAARQPKEATVPIALPPALKTPLMKRVTIEKPLEGSAADLAKKLADDNKLKFAIDPSVLKEYPTLASGKVTLRPQKDVRLDLLLGELLAFEGNTPTCVVRKDTLVVIPPGREALAKGVKGEVLQVLRQAPDATHTAAVAAIKKKLATKVDMNASNEIPVLELLQAISKKHELTFVISIERFKAEGVPNIGEAKPKIKAAKGATLESVLRDTLGTVDAELVLDPYGRLTINPKPSDGK
jgi:hypothetical protein